jgi:hypothetical protein
VPIAPKQTAPTERTYPRGTCGESAGDGEGSEAPQKIVTYQERGLGQDHLCDVCSRMPPERRLRDDAPVLGEVVAIPKRRRPRRVVITFPLSPAAVGQLGTTLDEDVEFVDVRAADGTEEAVLVPSSSRQLIDKIRDAFPDSILLIVEVEDSSHDLELGGQVMRSLDAGADGYYVARSLDQLAGVIDHALSSDTPSTHQPVELSTHQEDDLASILDRLIHVRADEAPATPPPREHPE